MPAPSLAELEVVLHDWAPTDDVLPTPLMRQSIRESAGLSHARIAAVLNVGELAVRRWEWGQAVPQGKNLNRYIALLSYLQTRSLVGAAR